MNFLRDAFGHLEVIGYLPSAVPLFVRGGVNDANTDTDAGLIAFPAASLDDCVAAASAGRCGRAGGWCARRRREGNARQGGLTTGPRRGLAPSLSHDQPDRLNFR